MKVVQYSSCIDAYDYNEKFRKLLIRFKKTQKYYIYHNVDSNTVSFIFNNPDLSVGKAYSICKSDKTLGISLKPTEKELLPYLL